MAVKTITIDMEAYDLLASCKKSGESFSKVIKRMIGEERHTAKNLIENLQNMVLSEEVLDATEEIYRNRREEMPEDVELGDDQ